MNESRITIRIPKDVHERLRVMAALKTLSINSLIAELLDQGTEKKKIDELYKKMQS
jgi:predicted HicB family RNase H-like nuclease